LNECAEGVYTCREKRTRELQYKRLSRNKGIDIRNSEREA
jgi:hypothetical protein